MTKREEARLNALLEKKEAEEREQKEFYTKVRRRRKEVLKVLGVDPAPESSGEDEEAKAMKEELKELRADMNALKRLAEDQYGCKVEELYAWIKDKKQIEIYKKSKNVAKVSPTVTTESE